MPGERFIEPARARPCVLGLNLFLPRPPCPARLLAPGANRGDAAPDARGGGCVWPRHTCVFVGPPPPLRSEEPHLCVRRGGQSGGEMCGVWGATSVGGRGWDF